MLTVAIVLACWLSKMESSNRLSPRRRVDLVGRKTQKAIKTSSSAAAIRAKPRTRENNLSDYVYVPTAHPTPKPKPESFILSQLQCPAKSRSRSIDRSIVFRPRKDMHRWHLGYVPDSATGGRWGLNGVDNSKPLNRHHISGDVATVLWPFIIEN